MEKLLLWIIVIKKLDNNMKKYIITSLLLFIALTGIALADNFQIDKGLIMGGKQVPISEESISEIKKVYCQDVQPALLGEQMLGATILFPHSGGTGTSTTPSYGELLIGNSQSGYDLTGTSTIFSAIEINDLKDVTTTGASQYDLLHYDGSSWVDTNEIGSISTRLNGYFDLLRTNFLEVSGKVVDGTLKIGTSTNAFSTDLLFTNTAGTGYISMDTSGNFTWDTAGATNPFAIRDNGQAYFSSLVDASYFTATTTTATSTFAGGLKAGTNDALVVDAGASASSLYITKAGNVGIGTTTPSQELEVSSGDNPGIVLNATGTGGIDWVLYSTDNTASISGGKFSIWGGTANEHKLVIDNSGNVGIGTTTPTGVLTVKAPGNGTYPNTFFLGLDSAGVESVGLNVDSENKLTIYDKNTGSWVAGITQKAGNVGIGTTTPAELLSLQGTNNQLSSISLMNTGGASGRWAIEPQTDDDLAFYKYGDNAGYKMVIQDNGNVGIGTTGPGAKLDVRDGNFILTDADVAHGVTDYLPTTAYNHMGPMSSTAGGLDFYGVSDTDATAMNILGIMGSTDPTDATPAIIIRGDKANGVATQALGASETVLQVKTLSTALMTVLGSGNVGIGTTAPGQELDVVGDLDGTYPWSYGIVNIESSDAQAAGKGGILTFSGKYTDAGGATNYAAIGGVKKDSVDSNHDGLLHFYARKHGQNIDSTGPYMTIDGSSGNVGIGTTAPDSTLTVKPTSSTVNTVTQLLGVLTETDAGTAPKYLQVGGSSSSITIDGAITSSRVSSAEFFEPTITLANGGVATLASTVYINSAPTEGGTNAALYVNSGDVLINTGNVGIGTTTPSSLLTVDGIIQTEERSTATCNASIAGGIYFDSDDKEFYGCNGTAWEQLSP